MKTETADLVTLRRPADGFLKGSVTLPGSKSETNRALVFGAFHPYAFTIYNFSDSDDSRVFVDFFNAVGIKTVVDAEQNLCNVEGNYRHSTDETVEFDLAHAGTALRFLTAFACALNGKTIFTGSPRLSERPIAPLINALRSVGASIRYLEREGCLPIEVTGNPSFKFQSITLNSDLSSQFLTSLLLLAPLLNIGATVCFDKNRLPSANYVQMTVNLLEELGFSWQWQPNGLKLTGREFNANLFSVESDWSAASYWLGHCATLRSDLQLYNLKTDSLQGDAQQLKLFKKWGLFVHPIEGGLEICNEVGNLISPIDENFELIPDLAQTFAVLACFAEEPSTLRGLQTLPFKETDRIGAVCRELNKMGLQTLANRDTIQIIPAVFETATPISTYGDHRMALSFSLLANLLGEIQIENPGVVSKSYPNYWKDLAQLGFSIDFS